MLSKGKDMSVLRSKIHRDAGLPESIMGNLAVWRPVQVAVCDCLTDLTGLDWEAAKINVSQLESKSVFANPPETGLAFNYITSDGQVPAFAHFDKSFAALISSKALSVTTPAIDEDYDLQMLDLILFKPVRDVLAREVTRMLASAHHNHSKLSMRAQCLSAAGLVLDRGLGALNEIKFTVKHTPDVEGDGSEAKEPADDLVLNFSLTLPQSAMLHIASTSVSAAPESGLDEPGPWAEHIYQSLKTATVPIRAVVESCKMTVADCTRLEVDDVIALPGASLQAVSLQTDMAEGPVNIGMASLGIYKSNWALKLSADLNEEIFVSLKTQGAENSVEIG